MPKLYKCKKCGVEHSPPTGKHCQQQLQGETAEQSQPANAETTLQQSVDKMLAGMLELTTKVTDMHERLSMVENRDNGDKQPMVPATQPEPFVSASIPGPAAASPDTLRANVELMAQAAARIANSAQITTMTTTDRRGEQNQKVRSPVHFLQRQTGSRNKSIGPTYMYKG